MVFVSYARDLHLTLCSFKWVLLVFYAKGQHQTHANINVIMQLIELFTLILLILHQSTVPTVTEDEIGLIWDQVNLSYMFLKSTTATAATTATSQTRMWRENRTTLSLV